MSEPMDAKSHTKPISAQVVLKPASGKRPRDGSEITAQNIHDYLPSEEAAARAKRVFADAGFEVGALVGNSFSITAPAPVFERVFKTRIRRQVIPGGEAVVVESGGHELPLGKLPKAMAHDVQAITFTPPPDFGPTGYMR
jgi:hypothetical protein